MFSVREVIGEAAGLDGKDLEKTYKGRAGGVVTIRSGMGEPIHKLATTIHPWCPTLVSTNRDSLLEHFEITVCSIRLC